VRALSGVLVQTDRFGTSVTQALRTHAAEQTATAGRGERKLGVKMVFPLVFMLFPPFFV
jgi:tight adherence protein C